MRIEELVYGTRGNETYLTLVLRKCDITETASLEPRNGVYMFYNKQGEVMYIGETTSIKRRIQKHLNPSGGKKEISRDTVAYIEYAYVQADRYERSIMEGLLVSKYNPLLNCDDTATSASMLRIPKDLLYDMVFYIKNTNLSDRVIARALGSFTEQVEQLRTSGVPNLTELPTGFTPSVVITEEMAEQLNKSIKLTKEDFFTIREMQESGIKQGEIASKFGTSVTYISQVKRLNTNRFKEWEKERLSTAS
jgi:predicted XRE-type DNA-binding protein